MSTAGRLTRRQPGQRLVIGSRRSLPNAFGDTRTPGGAWRRLYSLRSTIRATRRTVSASWPSATSSADRLVVLDVALDDRVEHVVGGQRVGVELVGPQLGARRLVDAPRSGIELAPGALVAVAAQRVHERLGHVLDARRSRRPCRRRAWSSPTAISLLLPVVSTSQPNLFESVMRIVAADARLEVLLGDAGLGPRTARRASRGTRRAPARSGPSACGCRGSSASASASVTLPSLEKRDGISTPDDVLGTERVGRDRGDERRVDAARQADEHVGEAVLAHVVAGAEHERLVHLAHRVERGSTTPARGDSRELRLADRDLGERRGARTRPRGSSARRRNAGRTSTSTIRRSSANCVARATRCPPSSNSIDAPSKTSSSWPPTRLT